MIKKTPVYITENNANYISYRTFALLFGPMVAILLGMILYLNLHLFMTFSDDFGEYKYLLFLDIWVLPAYLLHRYSDFGLRPLKLYLKGIEVPSALLSWKVPEMKKNKTLPTEFLPYNQIEKIETWFNPRGNINRQYVGVRKDWERYKEIVKIEMHPPLAKEVMSALKEVVGTEQLAEWLEKGGMSFLSESPKCKERAFKTLRKLVGDDVVEGISDPSWFEKSESDQGKN